MSQPVWKIWSCKIGEVDESSLPSAADPPMREAVARAYTEITGQSPRFIFSGWGAMLTESERAAHENRLPDPAKADLRTRLEALRDWRRSTRRDPHGSGMSDAADTPTADLLDLLVQIRHVAQVQYDQHAYGLSDKLFHMADQIERDMKEQSS